MTQQEKDLVRELIEEALTAATDYGYEIGSTRCEVSDIEKSYKDFDIASEKLYNWLDRQ